MADTPVSKPLLDKLGVKAGMLVAVLGIDDPDFVADLTKRVGEFATEVAPDRDAIFVAIDGPGDLPQLAELKKAIKPHGMIWAVYRKGQKDFNENHVLEGGLAAGLVDVKVARFSDTHTASKFVIRKAER